MCLDSITKRNKINNKVVRGFKILNVAYSHLAVHTPTQITSLEWGWNVSPLRAEKLSVDDGSGQLYPAGFHGFLTLEHAKKYSLYISANYRRIIMPVKFRNIRTHGIQCAADCIVAQAIHIDESIAMAAIKAWQRRQNSGSGEIDAVFVYNPRTSKPVAKAKTRKR